MAKYGENRVIVIVFKKIKNSFFFIDVIAAIDRLY